MTVRQQYNKERNRVKRLLRSMSTQGFLDAENLLPKEPKAPTLKSIEALKKITRESVAYQTQYFVDYETGEFVSGKLAHIRMKEGGNPFESRLDLERERTRKRREKDKERREKKKREKQPKPEPKTAPQQPEIDDDAENEDDVIIDSLIDDIKTIEGTATEDTNPYAQAYHDKTDERRMSFREDILNNIETQRQNNSHALAERIMKAGTKLSDAVDLMRFSSDQRDVAAGYATILKVVNG